MTAAAVPLAVVAGVLSILSPCVGHAPQWFMDLTTRFQLWLCIVSSPLA